MPSLSQASAPSQQPPTKERKALWSRLGGSAFTISLLVHGVFLILAIFFLYKWIAPPAEKIDQFVPGGGGGGNSGTEASHKIQKQMKNRMAPPSVAKRITSSSATAAFTLPESNTEMMNSVPMDIGAASAGTGGGAGGGHGTGIGTGVGSGSGPGSGPGSGRGFLSLTPFGARGGSGGLVGTFIDFKLRPDGEKPTREDPSMPNYIKIVQAFKRGGWNGNRYPHYSPKTTLSAKFFSFPEMQDRLAGPAFESKDTGPGLWVAHYRGRITASVPGKYRFVGYGDNVLGVKIGGKIVLDGSTVSTTDNIGIFGDSKDPFHEQVGLCTHHCSGALPIFAGEWVNFGTGEVEMEVVVGDQGGVFSAGLYIQAENTPLRIENGLPKLPLFMTGPVSDEERKLLRLVPEEQLKGPYFPISDSSKFSAGL